MIQETKACQCVCDNCGAVISFGEDWNFFNSKDVVQDWIDNEEDSMKIIDGKHICYDCIGYDEDCEPFIKPNQNL